MHTAFLTSDLIVRENVRDDPSVSWPVGEQRVNQEVTLNVSESNQLQSLEWKIGLQ